MATLPHMVRMSLNRGVREGCSDTGSNAEGIEGMNTKAAAVCKM